MVVLVPVGTTYIGLLKKMFKALKLRPENHTIGIIRCGIGNFSSKNLR